MPFESQAQRRFMYANHPEIAKRWEKHTPKGKLPEHKKKADEKDPLDLLMQLKKREEKEMNDYHNEGAHEEAAGEAIDVGLINAIAHLLHAQGKTKSAMDVTELINMIAHSPETLRALDVHMSPGQHIDMLRAMPAQTAVVGVPAAVGGAALGIKGMQAVPKVKELAEKAVDITGHKKRKLTKLIKKLLGKGTDSSADINNLLGGYGKYSAAQSTFDNLILGGPCSAEERYDRLDAMARQEVNGTDYTYEHVKSAIQRRVDQLTLAQKAALLLSLR